MISSRYASPRRPDRASGPGRRAIFAQPAANEAATADRAALMRYPVHESGGSPSCILRSRKPMAIDTIERTAKQLVLTVQDYSLFAWRAFTNLFRPPIYWPDFLIQSDIIGVGSLSIVILSGLLHRRRAGAAVGSHALGSLAPPPSPASFVSHHHDPRTGPGAHRNHGFRPQRLVHGQRTRLDGRHRADRRHARPGRGSPAQAGHPAHLCLHHACSSSSPSSPMPSASSAAGPSPSS